MRQLHRAAEVVERAAGYGIDPRHGIGPACPGSQQQRAAIQVHIAIAERCAADLRTLEGTGSVLGEGIAIAGDSAQHHQDVAGNGAAGTADGWIPSIQCGIAVERCRTEDQASRAAVHIAAADGERIGPVHVQRAQRVGHARARRILFRDDRRIGIDRGVAAKVQPGAVIEVQHTALQGQRPGTEGPGVTVRRENADTTLQRDRTGKGVGLTQRGRAPIRGTHRQPTRTAPPGSSLGQIAAALQRDGIARVRHRTQSRQRTKA